MSALTERMATAPRVPWRMVGVLALLIIGLVLAAIVYVGSQQRRLPEPFGPAANGLLAYSSGGDIYVGDLATGTTRLLIGGAETDTAPGFSPDGSRIAFLRAASANVDLFTVNADGSDLRSIATLPANAWVNWAPDSRRFAVIQEVGGGTNQLDLYDATGSGSVETITAAAGLDYVQFRPPDGSEILYRALVDGKWGLFAMDVEGTNQRTILQPTVPSEMDRSLFATYSADGSRIFYQHGDAGGCCQLWVVNADGSEPHQFIPNVGTAWDGQAVVSPDGTRVAFWHNFNEQAGGHGISVVRADGSGYVETGPKITTTADFTWAPDSSTILMIPHDDDPSATAYLLDPDGGQWTTIPWASNPGGQHATLDWQRLAFE